VVSDSEKIGQRALITLHSFGYLLTRMQLEFDVHVSIARIAFDLSHSPWWLDSIYGQFKNFYTELTSLSIAVEELNKPSQLTLNRLLHFDGVVILDPCARDYDLYGRGRNNSIPYSPEEIEVYQEYWRMGGNVMIVSLDNRTTDIAKSNELLSFFNVSFNYDRIPGVQIIIDGHISTKIVTDLASHPVTVGVPSFDYIGCSINYSENAFSLAWTIENIDGIQYNKTVMVGLNGSIGNRAIFVGSNYFIDNAGMAGLYSSDYNARLARQSVLWLIGDL
jgi:hypothetical protein